MGGNFMWRNPFKHDGDVTTLEKVAELEKGFGTFSSPDPAAPATAASPRSVATEVDSLTNLTNDRRLAAAPNSSSQLCSAGILSVGMLAGFILGKITKCRSQRRISREF